MPDVQNCGFGTAQQFTRPDLAGLTYWAGIVALGCCPAHPSPGILELLLLVWRHELAALGHKGLAAGGFQEPENEKAR